MSAAGATPRRTLVTPGRAARRWPGRGLLLLHAAGLVVLALVALAAALSDHSQAFFTREPLTAVMSEPCRGVSCSYAGALSNVTVLVWWTGVVIAFGAAWLAAPGPRRGALLAVAGFTALLAADDMFLLHEHVFGELERGEHIAMLSYGAVGAAVALVHRREWLRTPWPAALLAGGWIAVSVGFDFFWHNRHLFEDGAKLLAALTWTWFLAVAGRDAIR